MEGRKKVTFRSNPYKVSCDECGQPKHHRCREGGVDRPIFQPHGSRLTKAWRAYTAQRRVKKSHQITRLQNNLFRDPLEINPLTLQEFLDALKAS